MKKVPFFCLLLFCVFPLRSADLFEPFTIDNIRVEGLHYTSEATVLHYLPVQIHDQMTEDKSRNCLTVLYDTGLYDHIRLSRDGHTLVVQVTELPVIANIHFYGMSVFRPQTVLKGLRSIRFEPGAVFHAMVLKNVTEDLKKQYALFQREGTVIWSTVTPLPGHRVAVGIHVREGTIPRVAMVAFMGRHAYSAGVLRDQLMLRTPNFWSWYTHNDQFSTARVAADEQRLTAFYKKDGFIDFAVRRLQVVMVPDQRFVFLYFYIHEGQRYTVSHVTYHGPQLSSVEHANVVLSIKPGSIYDEEKILTVQTTIKNILQKMGYAFAVVRCEMEERNEAEHTVGIAFSVDPGRRYYVHRINITGNTQTNDRVVRRELRQYEGEMFDYTKVSRSKERVQRLGFFSDVSIDPRILPQSNNQVDLDVRVTERPTGSFQFGLGYSSAEKFVLSASLSYGNLLGTGKSAALQVSTSRVDRGISLFYGDPYWTQDGVSRNFHLYQQYSNLSTLGVSRYASLATGGGVSFGIPLNEYDNISVGFSCDRTLLTIYEDSPQRFKEYVATFGDRNVAVTQQVGWLRDHRDSTIYPMKGSYDRVYEETSLPGSPLRFYKIGYQHQVYVPLTKDVAFFVNAEIDRGSGFGGKPLPFFRNYFAGGIGTLRGYDTNSIGPRDTAGNYLGGDRLFVSNAELLFPVPGTGLDQSLRLAFFVDAAGVWGPGDALGKYRHIHVKDVRYSSGLSLSWLSPIGPLRFSYGVPIHAQPGDRPQRFQFTIGTVF